MADPNSPLRQLFDKLFPNTRDVQASYRQGQPRLLVEGGTANPGTLGAAFDYATRFALDILYDAPLARAPFLDEPDALSNIDAVIMAAQIAQLIGDRTTVFRASWALGLLTEVYRVGLLPGSPLRGLIDAGRMHAQDLLESAPPDALDQLTKMDAIARERLLPHLRHPLELGPTFDGSALCSADADVIADGLLLDLKTALGGKVRGPGGRADYLKASHLRQLIGYLLLDRSDAYGIDRVGIYSARFGHLVIWPVADVLEMLAGRPVDLDDVREQTWRVLGGDSNSK
ncbi:hypothetical protein [Microbacterium sp.]|uniref:hypothetical protein n=1 Tax=Microbacterium sp. TaxID=51671 RepID=UPI0028122D04|nr:hypothetical protein [Microbacterium sp.]